MCAYKVIVVDDDEMAAEALAFELEKKPEFSLDGIARNARQGKKLIAAVRPDLLFLDVEMPEMTGMELLRDIRDSIIWNMKVVFYTAYDKYMIEAIRESAFDYLLKPFQPAIRLWYIRRPMICVCCGPQKLVFSVILPNVSCGRSF